MGYQSKITSKGQTTIPQEIREYLKLKTGDRIEFVIVDGGVRIIAKNLRLADLAGIMGPPPKGAGATLEDIDEAIGRAVAEDDERIMNEWRRHKRTTPLHRSR